MDPVIEEMIESAKEGIEERKSLYVEWWDEQMEPLHEWWDNDRPWWLQKEAWITIRRPLRLRFGRTIKYIRGYHHRDKLAREYAYLEEVYPDLVMKVKRSSFGRIIYIDCQIDEGVSETEPVMIFLRERRWKIIERTDFYDGRKFKMKHPEYECTITLKARVDYHSACEVVEHKRVEQREVTEYEVICAGEEELTGKET